jgi:hypothetical protein
MLSFLVSDVPWRYDLRQEPDAVIPHVRSCAGGRLQGWSLPRHVPGHRLNPLKNCESFKPFNSIGARSCRRDRYQTGQRVSSMRCRPIG